MLLYNVQALCRTSMLAFILVSKDSELGALTSGP